MSPIGTTCVLEQGLLSMVYKSIQRDVYLETLQDDH